MSEQKKRYRGWRAERKLAIVLAGLRGDRSVKEVCREHQISEALCYSWRDELLGGGRAALAGKGGRRRRAGAVRQDRRTRADAGPQDL